MTFDDVAGFFTDFGFRFDEQAALVTEDVECCTSGAVEAWHDSLEGKVPSPQILEQIILC